MDYLEHFDYTALETAIYEAGRMILSARLQSENIHEKQGEANFVTDYDIAIQNRLMTAVREFCPNASFFGEEDGAGNTRRVTGEGYTFFIDPIDGTTNFMFDYHHSCVSIGVAKDGVMEAGFVYNPYMDEMFLAVRGRGAHLKCRGESRRLLIADAPLERGIAAFGCARYNDHDVDLMFRLVKELFLNSLSIRNGGSAALDLCRIAGGSNVLYVELKLQPYDYAAASILIEEAGGIITQADGNPITLDQPCSILAGTKSAHAEGLRMLRGL